MGVFQGKHSYALRRTRIARMIGEGAVALIPGGMLQRRNSDNDHLFRPESNFYYFTGWIEPNALLVIEGGAEARSTLFCAPRDPVKELWDGKRFGPDGAKKEFGVEETIPNAPAELVELALENLLRGKARVYASCDDMDEQTKATLSAAIDRSLRKNPSQELVKDLNYLIGEMRLIKDMTEIELMREAAAITARAHREILSIVRPGMTEYELEAEITYRFRKAGGHPHHAYPPIVASGANACTLHYNHNSGKIKDGDLVLVDAGCELQYYASDVTRTIPANGRFSVEQRAIYEVVLAAQKAAIHRAQNDVSFSLSQDVSGIIITEGLMGLGIIPKGDPQKAYGAGLHRAHYPHGVGHFLGLDVHDTGDLKTYVTENGSRRNERKLEYGMVVTVEPGIYIQPGTPGVDPKWHGIGVRIEDDVLVGHNGPEVLTLGALKEVAEIEEIMACARSHRYLSHE